MTAGKLYVNRMLDMRLLQNEVGTFFVDNDCRKVLVEIDAGYATSSN